MTNPTTHDVSYADSHGFTCPQCGQIFDAPIWLIVDTGVRPDLLARIRAGDLHAVACPTCGPLGMVDAPLLIYRPDGEPAVLFSPAQQTSAEQDQQQALDLVERLRASLGDDWQAEWTSQGISGVQRAMLPVVLSEDPEAALRQMQEVLERLRREDPEAFRRLEEEAREAVSSTQRRQDAEGDESDDENEDEHEDGDDEELPPALAAALQEVIDELRDAGVTIASPEDLETALAARPDLQARLERAASATDLPGSSAAYRKVDADTFAESLPDLLNRFLAAETWHESQQIVEQHPQLLSDEADAHFALALEENADDPDGVALLTEHRSLLARCREVGIARAFAEKMLTSEALTQAEQMGLTPEEFLAMQRAAQQMPPALREVLAELAASGVEIRSPQDLEAALAARPDLQAKVAAATGAADGGMDVPDEVRLLLGELGRLTRITDMPRRVDVCRQALRLVERADNPRLWAALQVELGNSLAQNPQGGRADNIEAAIEGYRQALQVRTRQAMPVEWAEVTMNLAIAYRNRIRGDKADNIERAIECSQQALQVSTRTTMPVEWATTMMNLANAYYSRIRGDRADNIEAAIDGYQQALQVNPRQAMPVEWATTRMNLATAYSDRIRGDKADNIERAIDGYQQALEEIKVDTLPDYHRRAQRSLGHAQLSAKRWLAAAAAYRAALATTDFLYAAAPTPEARQSQLAETQGVPAHLAFALLQATPNSPTVHTEAVLQVERFRARWLAESIALSSDRPTGVDDERWQAFTAAREQVQTLLAESRLPDATPGKRPYITLSPLLATARSELDVTIAAVRDVAPDFMPEPSFAQIQAAAQPDSPLVYLLATAAGGLALVVGGEEEHKPGFLEKPGLSPVTAIWLDDCTDAALDGLLLKRTDGEVSSGYLVAQLIDPQRLHSDLADLLSNVGRLIMAPLAAAMGNLPTPPSAVTLIPSGRLSLLPLHAAPVDSGLRFQDHFTVRYAPSALSVASATARPSTAQQPLLALGNPSGPATTSALFTDWLARRVAALLGDGGAVLVGQQASGQALQDALHQTTPQHLLFGCHGSFDPAAPLDSGLSLADGPFTLRRLLDDVRLDGVDLVTLCACQTAISDFRQLPDEAIGMPAAFLQAGARRVIGTLWSVDALATVLLLEHFYELLAAGSPGAAALQHSVAWLRTLPQAAAAAKWAQVQRGSTNVAPGAILHYDVRIHSQPQPFADPVYWAAFTYSGAVD